MGSTCSTLDGVDASRSRASQIEQEQREKDAAALEYEIARSGLGAEEHMAAIHADQFHRLLRADSFDDFQDM